MRRSDRFFPLTVLVSLVACLAIGFSVIIARDVSWGAAGQTEHVSLSNQGSPAQAPKPLGDPHVTQLLPQDGTRDVILDVEDPIVVRLDRSAKDFFVDFRMTPETSVIYENDPDKTEFRILPQEKLEPGADYTVEVFVRRRDESAEQFRPIGLSRFTTLPERPEAWSKDMAVRLEEARLYTRPSIVTGKYIDINLGAQTMALFQDGRLVDMYPVSSGKPGMDTPKGQFKIENKARRPFSKQYGLYMPYWMALVPSGLFGIHELPEWPGGYKEGAAHLGRPVSHGCVRLGVGPAEFVWNWADQGTPVVVH